MTAPFQLSDYSMTTHLCRFLETHGISNAMNHKINAWNLAFILRLISLYSPLYSSPWRRIHMLIWSTGVYPPSHTASKCRRKKFIACSEYWRVYFSMRFRISSFSPHRINTSIAADTRVLMEGARIYEGENSQVIQSFLCHCAPKIVLC